MSSNKNKSKFTGLPIETKVEVIAVSDKGDVYKTIKTILQFQEMEKKHNWRYQMFQIGFSQFKNSINI